jgi:cytochrome c556
MKKSIICITLAAVASGISGATLAQQKPEDVIKYRKAVMSIQSWHMRPMAAMVKGQRPFDAEVFAFNAQVIGQTARMKGDAFAPGTAKAPDVESRAKPEIWSEPEKFKQALDRFQAEASKLVEASKAGNLDAVRPAFGGVAKACGACHDSFRTK